MTMSVYKQYSRNDELCQTSGYFSLNLRKGAIPNIQKLLKLTADSVVAWVGCGDGRELLSIAKIHPDVKFIGYDINESAICIARRVMLAERLRNVTLHVVDFMCVNERFSHVYSTALAGSALYAHLRNACEDRLCMLKSMWMNDCPEDYQSAIVYLSGSGERKQLLCAQVQKNTLYG